MGEAGPAMHDAKSQANLDPSKVPENDWHASRNEIEPRCGADQWRKRDRNVVTYMHEMHDRHLGYCIRFASTKQQHASRLASLLEERDRRSSST